MIKLSKFQLETQVKSKKMQK